MRRITQSLNHLFRVLGHLLEGTMDAHGTGQALFVTYGCSRSFGPHAAGRNR